MLTITCILWAYQLVAGDAVVHSPLYRSAEACQVDADAKATQLDVPTAACFNYQFCFPLVPGAPDTDAR